MIRFAVLLLVSITVMPAADVAHKTAALLLAVDGVPGDGVPYVIERFQGKAAHISAAFLITEGEAPHIVADVYLDGDKLGVLLTKDLRMETTQAASPPALLNVMFSVPLPETAKPLQLRMVFRLQFAEALLGEVRLRVTPKGALKEALARLTDATRRDPVDRIVVSGPLKGLRELLREWKVPFDDEGMEMPVKLDAHTIAVSEALDVSHLPQLAEHSRMLILCADPLLEMDFKEVTADGHVLAIIRKPRKDDWHESPLLHRLLINQINQHLQSHE